MTKTIHAQPLTAEAFAPFGEVLEVVRAAQAIVDASESVPAEVWESVGTRFAVTQRQDGMRSIGFVPLIDPAQQRCESRLADRGIEQGGEFALVVVGWHQPVEQRIAPGGGVEIQFDVAGREHGQQAVDAVGGHGAAAADFDDHDGCHVTWSGPHRSPTRHGRNQTSCADLTILNIYNF